MIILAIESTCDETGVSIIKASKRGKEILSHVVASQRKTHNLSGGVVPEVAARLHAENIIPTLDKALQNFARKQGVACDAPTALHPLHIAKAIDAIAVASGPGLAPCLVVGVEAAKTLSFVLEKPLIAVNHMEGHVYSIAKFFGILKNPRGCRFSATDFPILFLSVSGGHTELILMKTHGEYELLGKTRDDAAGEALDKAARLLGLSYPGGPEIARSAKNGDPKKIAFPRPMIKSQNYDFSFAGLKTALRYEIEGRGRLPMADAPITHPQKDIADIAASFEQAVCDVLVYKTLTALQQYRPKALGIVGGVSANKRLREEFKKQLKHTGAAMPIFYPGQKLTGDNATMIALAGYYNAERGIYSSLEKIQADPKWELY